MDIKHDKKNYRFLAVVEGKESTLNYHIVDEHTWEYVRTYVPPELRSRGIAARIVEFALQYARENQLKIIPTCSYVKTYVDSHKKYQDLIKD